MPSSVWRFLHSIGIRREHAAKPVLRSMARVLTKRGVLPMELLMGAPLNTKFRADFPGTSFQYQVTPGDGLGARLYWQDWRRWEPYVVPQFAELAKNAARVLDIGAHTGVYSLFACSLNPQAEVYSFEPFPPVYAKLVQNLRVNGFTARSRTFQTAVSDAAGTARFHVDDDPTMCSLVDTGGQLEVPIIAIDSVVPLDGRTQLVKIDVEGHEDKALGGMLRVIKDSHPAIIFECNPGGPGRQIESILRGEDYRLFSLVEGVRSEIAELVPEKFPDHNHNFLALHSSRSMT